MFRIPENHGVEKSFGIDVGELKLPVLPGVGCVVDAGLIARPGRHEEGFVGGERDDGAEVESGGAGDLRGNPGAPGVRGAKVGAVGSASPGDVARDGADAAEALGGVGVLHLRGLCYGGRDYS